VDGVEWMCCCADDDYNKTPLSVEQDRQTALLQYDVPRPALSVASSSSSSSSSLAPSAPPAAVETTQPRQTAAAEETTSNVGPRDELFTSRDRRDVTTTTSDELDALLTEQDGATAAADTLWARSSAS